MPRAASPAPLPELREAAAGRAQRPGREQLVDARRARRRSAGGRTRRTRQARRRQCSAITFERPPRRISTARVRPTGGRADRTTSRIASSRSLRHRTPRPARSDPPARGHERRRGPGMRDAGRRRRSTRRRAPARSDRRSARAAPRAGTARARRSSQIARYWFQRTRSASRAEARHAASDRRVPVADDPPRDAGPAARAPERRSPARARWPMIARAASSSSRAPRQPGELARADGRSGRRGRPIAAAPPRARTRRPRPARAR